MSQPRGKNVRQPELCVRPSHKDALHRDNKTKMSSKKRQFKAQASSGRASSGTAFDTGGAFGRSSPAFGSLSPLSYISEPPDLSSITNPNVVVAFKNLSKKDATTKSKALEDLQTHISTLLEDGQELEEGILEAWVNIYPRTSIDFSRRVRQLAHTIQGRIALASGKRIAKHMSDVIGAWLAGLYDNDKPVARAAQDAFSSVFTTEEKRRSVWRVYERPTLEYVRDAILRETPQTLSDERSVSPDDAEAKHARVIGTHVCVVTRLISNSASSESKAPDVKSQSTYEELLSSQDLWKYTSHLDPFVRRSLYRLLSEAIINQRGIISTGLGAISNALISKALVADQVGSLWDLTETLVLLTKEFPSVWTDAYKGKKSALTRIRQFLAHGSQGGPPEAWGNMGKIFRDVPGSVMPQDLSEATILVEALHDGICSKDEPRGNFLSAWTTYIHLVTLLVGRLPESGDQQALVSQSILPLFGHHVSPGEQSSRWPLGSQGSTICMLAMKFILDLQKPVLYKALAENWEQQGQLLVTHMKASLPEQSKEYHKSQKSLAAEGERWASLNGKLAEDHWEMAKSSRSLVLQGSIETLISRSGKPYGAAAILKSSIHFVPLHPGCEEELGALKTFYLTKVPSLSASPSFPYLLSALFDLATFPDQEFILLESYPNICEAVLRTLEGTIRSEAILAIIKAKKQSSYDKLLPDPRLETYLLELFERSIHDGTNEWPLLGPAIGENVHVFSPESLNKVCSELARRLPVESHSLSALLGIDHVVKENPQLVKTSALTSSEVLASLLSLMDSSNEEISRHATETNTSLENVMSQTKDSASLDSLIETITRSWTSTSTHSASIPSLVARAEKLFRDSSDDVAVAAKLIPTRNRWLTSISPFLNLTPMQSLSVTDNLGSAVYLVSKSHSAAVTHQVRDKDGYSEALRLALYVSGLLKNQALVFDRMQPSVQSYILQAMLLTVQLANDNLGLAGANGLWLVSTTDVEEEISEFVSDVYGLLRRWIRKAEITPSHAQEHDFVRIALHELLGKTDELTPESFYSARAYVYIAEELIEARSWQRTDLENWTEQLTTSRKNKSPFLTIAFLNGYRLPLSGSQGVLRMCNELVSSLTGSQYSKEPHLILESLVLLNSAIQQDEITIPPQRLIPFAKNLMTWLDQGLINSAPSVAEVAKILSAILPSLKDVYGEHWSLTMGFLQRIWTRYSETRVSDEDLPSIYNTVKLYGVLRRIHESNDDAEDAWNESVERLSRGLLGLMEGLPNEVSDDEHQPLKVVNGLIGREITTISPEHILNLPELYRYVYSSSSAIQQATFSILHRDIPSTQEEVSVEVALSKSDARLPEEILSLILEAPTLRTIEDMPWDRSMPTSVRGYLFSWYLVFDHFTKSSFKVRSDYIKNLKDGKYLPPFLDFATDFLGHDGGKPVDASRFDVGHYFLDTEETPKKDAQWLLIHLYYLCLKHLPSLTKSWWIDCTRRQKVLAVESWTEKYISPLVIAEELDTVSAWLTSSEFEEGEGEMQVKVSKNAKEVLASYEVDEQMMQIVIKLPGQYPLKQAVVEGINRVGVDEKKWKSWLINTQGVITFSNGSIVDGLTAWRKNVTGTMKGQTECAICYSIISADKQLPSKRCGTCKNLFHSSCLWRWFKSSNSSSCPLCRNPFHYG